MKILSAKQFHRRRKKSNKSRDKIAHGHAYEKENEVNSLKTFLYLNKIYHLFLLLKEKT